MKKKALSQIQSGCVIICTYNRCLSLKNTLDSLTEVSFPSKKKWEVLVVNNNSKDNTEEIVKQYEKKIPLRYLKEEQQGLSFARNRAIKESDADLFLFTDDDVSVDSKWIEAIADSAMKYPDAGYFGGKIIPSWSNGKPGWFKDETLKEMGGLIINYDLGNKCRLYTNNDPLPIGANMAFRSYVFKEAGVFRLDLGVSGNKLYGGEDTEMITRIRNSGIGGVYVADAICHHGIEKKRMTLKYAFKYGYDRELSLSCVEKKNNVKGSFFRFLLFLIRGLYQSAKGRGDRLRLCIRNAGIELSRILHKNCG